jgi:hypothetical protein
VNTRERLLALVLLLVVVLGGVAFLVHRLLFVPLDDADGRISYLEDQVSQKEGRVRQVLASLPRLQRWKMLSLPVDSDPAHREYDQAYLEYEKYLTELMQKSGFQAGSFSVIGKPPENRLTSSPTAKRQIYTPLSYTVNGHGNLASLVKMLEGFYRTGLLQQIKNLTIRRPLAGSQDREDGDIEINLTIEALVLAGAEKRSTLLPGVDRRLLIVDVLTGLLQGQPGLALAIWASGPTGPAGPGVLAEPPRRYAAIARENIFFGQPQELPKSVVDVTRFVNLTDITHGDKRTEAFLYDVYNNKETRLRAERGFDSFRVEQEEGKEGLRGKVIRILDRDLLLEINGKYYKMHVGDSLVETMKNPLKGKDLEAFGLVAAPAKRRVPE